MSNNSSSPNLWSLLKWGAFAIFPPFATTFPAVQQLTQHNIWLTSTLIVLYELALGLIYLLTKVWQRIEDPWTQNIADAIDRQTRMKLSRYHFHYCRFFHQAHKYPDVKAISQQGPFPLELERIFVDLRVTLISPDQASPSPVRTSFAPPKRKDNIWGYLEKHKHLVILGAPGSGKTTLLKHLGLTLIQHPRSRYFKHIPHLLPILLFLHEHSVNIVEKKADYTLVQAIRRVVQGWQRPMPSGWIEQQLARRHCLVLLDGLDKIADATQHRSVVEWIEQQMVAYAGNRFVITSRPYGYRSEPLTRATILEVQLFTFDQIAQFVTNWCIANEIKNKDDPGRDRKKAEELIRRLREKEALIELTTNPLLLTMAATLHWYRDQDLLAKTRIALYKQFCEILLETRQNASETGHNLSVDQKQLVLQSLAYQMLSDKEVITISKAEQMIVATLQQVSTDISPKQFLSDIENSSGLLIQREPGIYSFAHPTFQEYLVALYIRKNNLEQELLTLIENNSWHETICLYCAQADATAILNACLQKATTSVSALTLALSCMKEVRDVPVNIRQDVQGIIEQGVEDNDPTYRRIVAEAILSQRLHQMRPVNERFSIDTTLVTNAEYQLFLDEERVHGKYFQPDHWTSESFPPKAGRLPVLGVTQTDALAFCAWLTTRNKGLWEYRLPSHEEWKQAMMSTWREPSEIGFWANKKAHFIWAKGMAPSSLQTQYDEVCGMAIDLYFINKGDYNSKLALIRVLSDILEPFSKQDPTIALAHILDLDHVHISALALTRTLEQSPTLASTFDLAHVHNCVHTLIDSRDFDCTRTLALARDLVYTLARARAKTPALDDSLKLAATIYTTYFFLQQRQEGILPTYEGIFLVKERKETV